MCLLERSTAEGNTGEIETAEVDFDSTYAETHAETMPGRYVMLAVSDTGIGMEQDHINTLFKTFQQIRSQKPTCDGVGLGLAICLRRWLRSGPQGERDGFTADPLFDNTNRTEAGYQAISLVGSARSRIESLIAGQSFHGIAGTVSPPQSKRSSTTAAVRLCAGSSCAGQEKRPTTSRA